MNYQNLLVEFKGKVCYVSFNRPDALNALNSDTLNELDDALNQISENIDIAIVVFTGMEKSFIAGADISEMVNMNYSQANDYAKLGASIFRKIEILNKVTIAAINGYCLGGGNELAMACDMRIASNKAKFGQPEVSLGITPGFSGTQRLTRLIGLAKAKELLFTGKMIDANEAYTIGLVNLVTEPVNLMTSIDNITKVILKNSQIAIQYTKKAVNEGFDAPIEDAIDLENIYFAKCFDEVDQKEGMNAFLEKRKANFK